MKEYDEAFTFDKTKANYCLSNSISSDLKGDRTNSKSTTRADNQ